MPVTGVSIDVISNNQKHRFLFAKPAGYLYFYAMQTALENLSKEDLLAMVSDRDRNPIRSFGLIFVDFPELRLRNFTKFSSN